MRAVARSMVGVRSIAASAVLLAVASAACGSRGAAPAAVSPALRPSAPFVPGSTTPARRARLQAIASKLDELLRAQMRDAGATGVVAGVVLDGELAYARAIGVRDLAGALLAMLSEGGVLGTPADPPPVDELTAAAAAIDRLAASWDADLAARTFDAPSLRFAWFGSLRDDFARLGASHGACRRNGAFRTYGRHRGVWTLVCDRGAITFDALMTPGTPARVEIVKWTDELPLEDRQRAIAMRLTAAMGQRNDASAAMTDVVAASADRDRLARRLAHLAIDHGACEVTGGTLRSHHEPLGDDAARAILHLQCVGGPLDREITLDDQSGRVVDLDGHPPHDPDATCWQ